MVYYKIPVLNGVFDYPAGCVLCCAYYMDGYMYCKFECVVEAGSSWERITADAFDKNCPAMEQPSDNGITKLTLPIVMTEGVHFGDTLPDPGIYGRIYLTPPSEVSK